MFQRNGQAEHTMPVSDVFSEFQKRTDVAHLDDNHTLYLQSLLITPGIPGKLQLFQCRLTPEQEPCSAPPSSPVRCEGGWRQAWSLEMNLDPLGFRGSETSLPP